MSKCPNFMWFRSSISSIEPDPEDKSKIAYLEDQQTFGRWGSKQVTASTMNKYRSCAVIGRTAGSMSRPEGCQRATLSKMSMLQVWTRNGLQVVPVAVLSTLGTVLTMYMLGLATFPAPESVDFEQHYGLPDGSLKYKHITARILGNTRSGSTTSLRRQHQSLYRPRMMTSRTSSSYLRRIHYSQPPDKERRTNSI